MGLDKRLISRCHDTKSVRKIGVRLWITEEGEENNIRFVHIAVSNSNVDNVTVFEDLNKTFDFNVAQHQEKST